MILIGRIFMKYYTNLYYNLLILLAPITPNTIITITPNTIGAIQPNTIGTIMPNRIEPVSKTQQGTNNFLILQ